MVIIDFNWEDPLDLEGWLTDEEYCGSGLEYAAYGFVAREVERAQTGLQAFQ